MLFKGFMVAQTEKAIAIVRESDAGVVGVKPLWLPRKKILALTESDSLNREIQTAQGRKQGIPHEIEMCDEFATKVGW